MVQQRRTISSLLQLQNRIKRDPKSYHEDFIRQHAVYNATKVVFQQNPSTKNGAFIELVMFLSHVTQCYSEELKEFPEELVDILQRHGPNLHPAMRLALVKALVLIRNKNLISPTSLLGLFFKLISSPDKGLRKFLKEHIIQDIRNINKKCKDTKLNKQLQSFMIDVLKDNHAVAVKTSLDVMVELYKKGVWNDARTVNVIAGASFSKITKVTVAAIKFFVGSDEQPNEDSEDESADEGKKESRIALKVCKKKKSSARLEERLKRNMENKNKKRNKKLQFDFSAIHLLNDPQALAERLYRKMDRTNERFEVKLMIMNFLARLVGIHQLYLPNLYPYLQRYMFVKQREVTKVMAYAAQATHEQVPPDDLYPVVRTLANNFVTERNSGEVMAMGLNAIREVCARNVHCIEQDLLHDLTSYAKYKDRAVSIAARSIIKLFRDCNPELLQRKNRCAPTEHSKEVLRSKGFGDKPVYGYIPGAEVLELVKADDQVSDDSDGGGDDDETFFDDSDDDPNSDDGDETKSNVAAKSSTKVNKTAIRQVMKMTAEERAARAQMVLMTRALTNTDFQRINAMQAAKEVERYAAAGKDSLCKKKRNYDQVAKEDAQAPAEEVVSLSRIETVHKSRKMDRDQRLETRQGHALKRRTSKFDRMNPHASTSNKDKLKGKSFMMVKHKIRRSRNRLSYKEKHLKLKNKLKKMQYK